MRQNDVLESEDKFDLTSMIDVVFLLLIYFMYLPIQQEADLMFSLPSFSQNQDSGNAPLPSEQMVEIAPDGSVFLNGTPMGEPRPDKFELKELASVLRRLKISADRSGIPTIVIRARRLRNGGHQAGILLGSRIVFHYSILTPYFSIRCFFLIVSEKHWGKKM